MPPSGGLFEEMKTKLLAHAHAEQEVLYRPLEASQSEASRSFAHEGTNEHQIVEQQLQKLSADGNKAGEQWTAELKVLRELVEHHVEERKARASAVHARISGRTNSKPWPSGFRPEKHNR
jgi:Hemerythrin HHE cation binding domain